MLLYACVTVKVLWQVVQIKLRVKGPHLSTGLFHPQSVHTNDARRDHQVIDTLKTESVNSKVRDYLIAADG